jgi:hypothetical protein
MLAFHIISAKIPRKRSILEKRAHGSSKSNNLDYEKSPECKEIFYRFVSLLINLKV